MNRTIRNFWIRTGVLLGAMILAFGLAAAGPVAAAGTGTVTGQVLSLDDVALPNVHLAAFTQAPGTPNRIKVGEFLSDAQGRYSVQVPAGQIWMEFETQDINGQSFWGYDNLPVDVAADQTVSSQDFRVAIRVVSEPPTAVTQAPTATAVPQAPTAVATATAVPTVVAPGMPVTGSGSGSGMLMPVLAAFGLLMVTLGLVQRRRAPR